MVTAVNGIATFRSRTSGLTRNVSFYTSDVVGAKVTFSTSGLAGTGDEVFVTFGEPVILEDISQVTGPTVAKVWNLTLDGNRSASVLSFAQCLDTLNNRPKIAFSIGAGQRFGMVQA